MGLDMYLTAEKYVSPYSEQDEDIHSELSKIQGMPGKITHISCDVGYWRKANQIHAWFVTNVQDRNDDCGKYFVSQDKLKELYALCSDIFLNNDLEKGKSELPTTPGFFFGDTEYDEFYMEDIQNTVNILHPLISKNWEEEGFLIYYQSSW